MSIGAGVDLIKDRSVVIDYTSNDMESLEEDLRVFAQTQFHDRWTNFNNTEFAVVFLKLFAYFGDLIFYQFNATIGETQPATAIRRRNFINIAKGYDYILPGESAASVDVEVVSDPSLIPYPLGASTFKVQTAAGAVFMPAVDTLITASPQTVSFVAGDLQDSELLGTSDGKQNQSYELAEKRIIFVSGANGNAPDLEVRVNGVLWTSARNRVDAQSIDQVYFVDIDEDDTVTVTFGDNINGKIPAVGADIRATYKVGGGAASNINPRTITNILTPLPGVISLTNPLEASGGKARQTLREAKSALPASISTNNRAVTAKDFSDILVSNKAPAGIAKASSAPGVTPRDTLVWVVPAGGGAMSFALKNDIAAFLSSVKMVGSTVDIRDAVEVELVAKFSAFVKSNFRSDDVLDRLRQLFITEDPSAVAQTGIFDFDNIGLGARDDEGEPQITESRIQSLARSLADFGLQKLVIDELRTIPTAKQPTTRINTGDGGVSDLIYIDALNVPRREFRVVFNSATNFSVFRRIVGRSTFVTDDSLVDDRLDLTSLSDYTLPLPAGTVLNPNRQRTLDFAVDTATTTGNIIFKTSTSAGSIFGNSAPGDDYYLEIQDGTGDLPGPVSTEVTYVSSIGDLSFKVNSGAVAWTAGDEITFDVFPLSGDLLLRDDELPVFERDSNGVAINLTIEAKTAE